MAERVTAVPVPSSLEPCPEPFTSGRRKAARAIGLPGLSGRRLKHHLPERRQPAHAFGHVLAGGRRPRDVPEAGRPPQLIEPMAAGELPPPRLVADLPPVALAVSENFR